MLMKTIKIRDRHVTYEEMVGEGCGQTLLLVHGAADHSWIWHDAIYGINSRHRRIAINLPGRLGSDGPPIGCAQDFRTFITELVEKMAIERFVFMGHSMGGSMALDFAVHCGDRLIGFGMLGSSPKWEIDADLVKLLKNDPEKGVKAVNDDFGLFSSHTVHDVRRKFYFETGSVSAETAAVDLLACTTYQLEDVLETIALPALIVCGDEDIGSLPGSRLCAARIRDVKFVEISRCGHSLLIEQPKQLTQALNNFVDGL